MGANDLMTVGSFEDFLPSGVTTKQLSNSLVSWLGVSEDTQGKEEFFHFYLISLIPGSKDRRTLLSRIIYRRML